LILAYLLLLATFFFLLALVSSPLSFLIGAVFVVFCFGIVLVVVESI